jgi:hypothetical protein
MEVGELGKEVEWGMRSKPSMFEMATVIAP